MAANDFLGSAARRIIRHVLRDWKPGESTGKLQFRVRQLLQGLLDERLNSPEIQEFIDGLRIEAAHQRERWKDSDTSKENADFFWLLGWLGGKAVHDPHEPGDKRSTKERRLHRIIAVAAAAYNWHQAVLAKEA